MGIGASHACSVQHHGSIEQGFSLFFLLGERLEEVAKGLELGLFVLAELVDHFRAVTVVGDVVDDRGVNGKRDQPGRVGFDGEFDDYRLEILELLGEKVNNPSVAAQMAMK